MRYSITIYSTSLQSSFFRQSLLLTALFLVAQQIHALTDRYRCTWRENPATTMVIGWDQVSGSNPQLHLSEINYGKDVSKYNSVHQPDRIVQSKGMNNHFVRLTNLRPNTTYYFVISDSEGLSRSMAFQTAPISSFERLSIIAGGDSRNNQDARRRANAVVGKLRPHFVLFAGDMTGGDSGREWQEWLDDWQLTMTREGQLTPVVVARGNHELTNQTLVDMFDVPNSDVYYALTFGRDLLRVYTLNSAIPAGGVQFDWLERDLHANSFVTWKMAQYHHGIRPHTRDKSEQNDQYIWAKLFHKHDVNLVMESDAHVVKCTWPIRPSTEPGHDEGFVRDDENGTVYIGEGCWGAPLRANNDDKSWTRSSGSFNQFKWIFVDADGIEVRTIKTDESVQMQDVSPYNRFEIPIGLSIWRPANGDVIHIKKRVLASADTQPTFSGPPIASKAPTPRQPESNLPEVGKLRAADGKMQVKYVLDRPGEVSVLLIDGKMQLVKRYTFQHNQRGTFLKDCLLAGVPNGNYEVVIKCDSKVIQRYELSN